MTTIRLFAILSMDYYILGGIIMLDFSSEVFYRGECFYAYKYFGAHITDGGVMFRVYAPAARRIELIGEFNGWNGENSAMKTMAEVFMSFSFLMLVKVRCTNIEYIRLMAELWIKLTHTLSHLS